MSSLSSTLGCSHCRAEQQLCRQSPTRLHLLLPWQQLQHHKHTSKICRSQCLAGRLRADLQAVAIELQPLPLRQQLPRHVQLAEAPEAPQALDACEAVALQVELLEAVQLLQACQGGDVVVLQAPMREVCRWCWC